MRSRFQKIVIINFVPDGAAVSTGTTEGVAARLKQLNPRLINFTVSATG